MPRQLWTASAKSIETENVQADIDRWAFFIVVLAALAYAWPALEAYGTRELLFLLLAR